MTVPIYIFLYACLEKCFHMWVSKANLENPILHNTKTKENQLFSSQFILNAERMHLTKELK